MKIYKLIRKKIDKEAKFKCLGLTTHLYRYDKRRNLSHNQSSEEQFWKKRTQRNTSRQTTPHITQKPRNVPMCLTNNDLWLPNVVSL